MRVTNIILVVPNMKLTIGMNYTLNLTIFIIIISPFYRYTLIKHVKFQFDYPNFKKEYGFTFINFHDN